MSRHPCPQCQALRVLHLRIGKVGYGSCLACAVVLRWTGPGWRILTAREWKRKPNLAMDVLRKVTP